MTEQESMIQKVKNRNQKQKLKSCLRNIYAKQIAEVVGLKINMVKFMKFQPQFLKFKKMYFSILCDAI